MNGRHRYGPSTDQHKLERKRCTFRKVQVHGKQASYPSFPAPLYYRQSIVPMAQEARIAVMGATGSGKSTFINLVSGSNLAVSNGMRSCTTSVEESQQFTLDGRMVTLIDTPGFDDTFRSDTDILESISEHLASMYGAGTTLAGVIYMYRISDVRMGGTSRRNFRLFRELCGKDSLRNVLIVTTMWSSVDPNVGATREEELAMSDDFFKPVLDEGARLVRHDGGQESAQGILRHLIHNEGTPLRIQRELVDERKPLADTAAGAELSHQLTERIGRLEGEIGKLRDEITRLIVAKDEKARNELLLELLKTQNEKDRIERENKRLEKDGEIGQLAMMLATLHMVSLHERIDTLKKEDPPQVKGWFSWW
ncbi:P-loop containing nucleoside triphosphate hydrolase protein [Butyriboletus roseoflavus]|nr:P-loop containing nucleoside triphosphate hydrolase protein [Butyriboletus roseoflavus]